ncbi:MAG TPA: thioesterase domain-containing protein [Ignavibacteria bacterium]|nr:thioesterase domain-containing protein [Ignavibacteria bacterium]
MNNITKKKSINVFCLPYAGGNKYSYREFEKTAPEFLNLITLDYPGRIPRIREPLLPDINGLVNDIYRQIKHKTDLKEYAIYGHSMGGLIASLLTKKLIENKHRVPLHLFITGTSGPSAPSRREKKRHLLPQKEFLQEMKDLDGIPEEILQTEELLHFFEPVLRSDFRACENYIHTETEPFNIPVTVITGADEDMEKVDIHLWQKETRQIVDFRVLPGNHFFIYDNINEIMEIISEKLSVYTKLTH